MYVVAADGLLRFPMLLEQLFPHGSPVDQIPSEPPLNLYSLAPESSLRHGPL